ncbi:MAG: hypothetical protein KAX40_04525 [Herpetosiphon sp.]|nr:hypothetical protein [Herpetosiphon sp.]
MTMKVVKKNNKRVPSVIVRRNSVKLRIQYVSDAELDKVFDRLSKERAGLWLALSKH